MKVHVEDKESMQEPHRTAPHMQFGMVMQLLSRRFVFFLLKFWVSNAHLDWDVSKNRTPKSASVLKKRVKKAKTFGPLLGLGVEKTRRRTPMRVFFPWKKPQTSDLQNSAIAEAFYANTFMGILIRLAPGLLGFAKVRSCGFLTKRS